MIAAMTSLWSAPRCAMDSMCCFGMTMMWTGALGWISGKAMICSSSATTVAGISRETMPQNMHSMLVFEFLPEGFHELVLSYGLLHAARHLAQDHRSVERLLLSEDERVERSDVIRNLELRADRIAAEGFGHRDARAAQLLHKVKTLLLGKVSELHEECFRTRCRGDLSPVADDAHEPLESERPAARGCRFAADEFDEVIIAAAPEHGKALRARRRIVPIF